MKNDHNRDDTDSDANDYEINGTDADALTPATADHDADEFTGDTAAHAGSDWDAFQFDSPELAAYATYADADQDEADTDAAETDHTAGSMDDPTALTAEQDAETVYDSDYATDDTHDDDSDSYERPDEDLIANMSFDPALDIDAALAAVGALPDLMAERDVADASEYQRQQEAARTAEQHERWREGYRFAQPPQIRLQRGQPASVIPALILIAVGAYLTFALTLSQTPPAPGMVALLVGAAMGVTLLSYWLNARRWARGALFGGLLLILSGLMFYVITTPSLTDALPAGLVAGGAWRLFIGAAFVATALAGLLARPVSAGLTALGLGGLIGTVMQLLIGDGVFGDFSTTLAAIVNESWKIVLPLFAVLMLVGLFQRLRQRRQIPAA